VLVGVSVLFGLGDEVLDARGRLSAIGNRGGKGDVQVGFLAV
jgi:hypothetical protein